MKNKMIFFNKWPSIRCLDALLFQDKIKKQRKKKWLDLLLTHGNMDSQANWAHGPKNSQINSDIYLNG